VDYTISLVWHIVNPKKMPAKLGLQQREDFSSCSSVVLLFVVPEHIFCVTKLPDSVSSFNSALDSGIKVVRGASFDKKEFKRNVVGSGAYAPTTTVVNLRDFDR
jgi:hypothetical protein